jgi:alkylhydroperoxidase/carboxymuconolactone decarboxylase family protein YurZ
MKLASQDAVAALDPDFGQMAVHIGRHAWGLPDLTMREKTFVFVAADLCNHNIQFPLQAHVMMGMSNGVAIDDVREAVRHLAPYVGYPTAAETMMRLIEIEKAAGVEREPGGTPTEAPSAEIPADVLDGVRPLDADFAGFLEHQFAERWARPNLTVRERALCTIAADVMNGTLEDSFRLHVDQALANGAGEEQVRAVLLLVSEYGIAKSWRAYAALDAHLHAA